MELESAGGDVDGVRLPILGLHHVALTTNRLEASLRFYTDVLGFRQLRRPPFSFRGAWLFGYGIQIHLIESAAMHGEPEPIDSRRNHVALRVTRLEPMLQHFKAYGVPILQRINAGGTAQVFVQDPDGHHWEFSVMSEPSRGYEGPG